MLPWGVDVDLCIIGGGINGVGIARDAAGRGLKVLLLEKGDLASATSSASSKMIHGGLRYLEFFEFGLVRKSLAEREVMLRIAPQIVKPMRFCIPQNFATRPAWMVRLGLFIYDHLWRGNRLPQASTIALDQHPFGQPLKVGKQIGFAYSDCWVDDARLVVLNAMDAKARGATILTHTPCTGLAVVDGKWQVQTPDGQHQARVVINATGPYTIQFLRDMKLATPDMPKLRLVQGSHIVLPKLYEGDHAYLLQQPDGRVVFVWPYEQKYTMVGTTETVFHGTPSDAKITPEETAYLLESLGRFFKEVPDASSIVWSFSGVRPLFDDNNTDAKKVTRDYRFYRDVSRGAPILSIFGGKLTTYRPLAEEALTVIKGDLPHVGLPWTYRENLPITDIDPHHVPAVIDDKTIEYFTMHEFAKAPDDVLWRRTKWGLHMTPDQRTGFSQQFYRLKENPHD